MKNAPGFIASKRSLIEQTSCCPGQGDVNRDDVGGAEQFRRGCRSSRPERSSRARNGSKAMTFMPSDRATVATRLAIRPKPTRPRVLPSNSIAW